MTCAMVWEISMWQNKTNHLSTLASSTLNILFSEMLKFSKIIFSKSKNIVKKNSEYLGIFHFVEMNVSKLINYLMDMCWNGQGTSVPCFPDRCDLVIFFLMNFQYFACKNNIFAGKSGETCFLSIKCVFPTKVSFVCEVKKIHTKKNGNVLAFYLFIS
jgi:hypothetical protein